VGVSSSHFTQSRVATQAKNRGSFVAMEKLQKLQKKRKVSKVRGYMGTREFFWGKEKDVYI